MEKIKALLIQHKDFVLYAVFGVLTTLVNLIVFHLFTEVWDITPGSTLLPNIIANVVAILFAFVTNRTIVFHSDKRGAKGILMEAAVFFAGRGLTLLLDLGIVYLFVDVLHGPKMLIKLASTVLVILINYVISKWVVFRKKEQK